MAPLAILLCAYNGVRYLGEQLDTLAAQDYRQFRIYVSDDRSSDGTIDILKDSASRFERRMMDVRVGPGAGAASNFLSLICSNDIVATYYAYCDQDDVWDKDKLSRAIEMLSHCDPAAPALYCGRTRSLSSDGKVAGLSPLFARRPSFANALVQNIAGGNTMVMNNSARELLKTAGIVDVVSHDWWTYLLVSGAGGAVIYDPKPCLDYRQHSANEIGANTGFKRRLMRYFGALSGRNRDWNDRNIAALEKNVELLTTENQQRLKIFSDSRHQGVFTRLRGSRRAGLYAHTFSGNLGLLFATLLKKI